MGSCRVRVPPALACYSKAMDHLRTMGYWRLGYVTSALAAAVLLAAIALVIQAVAALLTILVVAAVAGAIDAVRHLLGANGNRMATVIQFDQKKARKIKGSLEERVGFEPTEPVKALQFSRLLH